MRPNYTPFITRMIQKYEGGYGWDAGDPGGPTKYGITCFDLAEHRGKPMLSMTAWAPQVQKMTLQEAEDIYARKYAAAIKFDELPSGVDCVVMDYAVNSGIGRARTVLHAMFPEAGKVPGMTPQLLSLIKREDPVKLIDALCDERLGFLKRIRKGSAWKIFGRGWNARVADLRSYAKLRRGSAAVPSTVPVPRTVKGTNKPAPASGSQHAANGGMGVIIATALHDHPVLAAMVILALAAGLFAWYMWKRARAAKLDGVVVLPGDGK